MNIFLIIGGLIVIMFAAGFWAFVGDNSDDDGFSKFGFWLTVAGVCYGVYHFWHTPTAAEVAAENAQEAARIAERERPRKIQEIDGCTIYSFYREAAGRTYYFTNCQDTVTTDNSHKEKHGKTTREVQESIVTQKK
jgi:hypothetical protein